MLLELICDPPKILPQIIVAYYLLYTADFIIHQLLCRQVFPSKLNYWKILQILGLMDFNMVLCNLMFQGNKILLDFLH